MPAWKLHGEKLFDFRQQESKLNPVGHGPLKDITGKTFGELLVLCRASNHPSLNKPQWLCLCSCKKHAIVLGSSLSRGFTKSCGHLALDARKQQSTHGMTATRIYKVWTSMKERCCKPTHKAYARYGGRGIAVCDRWFHSFKNFYADMGPKPSRVLTLERRNNDGNYEPGNCYWATRRQQAQNRKNSISLILDGRTMPLGEAAELLGVQRQALTAKVKMFPSRKLIDARLWGTRGPSKIK